MSRAPSINKTIIKMVQDLKETGRSLNNTPLKRSLSSNSFESSIEEQTPLKKFKQENSFNMSYVGSPREMIRIRADLVEARNTIIILENRIQHMHGVQKEMRVMFDNETEDLKRQHEYDRNCIEQLEMQLQTLRKREASLKAELSEMKSKYNELKSITDEKILSLEKDISDLKDESQLESSESNAEICKLQKNIAELQNMLEAAQEDADAQKNLVLELGKQLSEKNSVEIELEQVKFEYQKTKNQLRILENAKEEYLEYQQQAKFQAHKLAHYIELEKENAQLKEDFARLKVDSRNKSLLEEEVHDLRSRLGKHKELEKKVADLQAQYDQTQMYLSEWRAVARGFCESTERDAALPHLLRTAIERLQQQELSLTADKVDYETQLKSAQHAAKVAKAELEKTHKLVTDLKSTNEQKQTLIHRMQKKLLLVSRERDSYRLQLDSYERDLTMTMVANSSTNGFGGGMMQSQKERIDSLEKIVDGYRDLLAKLENDLQEAQPLLNSDLVPIKQDQLSLLQDEVVKLRDENERLREHRDRLEIQLESLNEGNDSLHGGQVVHLAANPLSECIGKRQSQLEQVVEENMRLKTKLKKIEEGVETSKLGDVSICPKEVASLKDQIKEKEKQTQRMMDKFKSSIQELRNMIYMLFGYKIDRPSTSSKYILRNMYAERQDDILCFEVNQDGDLNLLENEFSATLGPMIELHLIHQKSIPVFLSAITLDLFNQKTMTKSY